ncbi:MAG: DUF3500 domain-containing protein [Pseudomonadota bacterium]
MTSPNRNARRIPATVSRRETLALGAAAALAGPAAFAATETVGRQMLDRAQRFLSLLDDRQAEEARFDFDSRTRRRWNYMLGARTAPGLPLEDMQPEQKDAALDLLSSALSEEGMTKAERIMLQQDILRDEWGKGPSHRNRERFSTAIFGTPSEDGAWAWRFEGHHLTLSFTLLGSTVISITPSSFSSEPNTVPSGPHKGMVVLPDEETLGRILYADLTETTRKAALIRDRSYGNIITRAGSEDALDDAREGVALGDLSTQQAQIAERLMQVYAVDNFAAPLAEEQRGRLAIGDPMAVRFGWAGADLGGPSIYYRLHGESFLIEFATVRNQPLHHHTIRHDLERNLGDHLV